MTRNKYQHCTVWSCLYCTVLLNIQNTLKFPASRQKTTLYPPLGESATAPNFELPTRTFRGGSGFGGGGEGGNNQPDDLVKKTLEWKYRVRPVEEKDIKRTVGETGDERYFPAQTFWVRY